MHKIIVLSVLFLITITFAQTQLEPSVTDNGGGQTSSSSYKLLSSIGQSVSGSNDVNLGVGFITVELVPDTNAVFENQPDTPDLISIGEFAPNPFNSKTQIIVKMPKDGKLSLKVFDMNGNLKYSEISEQKIGTYNLTFHATDEADAGMYLYKIQACESQKTGKFIFVK